MCGLAGYYRFDNQLIKSNEQMLTMLRVQKHRGPDDSGIRAFHLENGSSIELNTKAPQSLENNEATGILGFNRLSILDLSYHGHQPMISEDGNVILCFNGEIYNAFDYKNELEQRGAHFRSKTDSEVILHLYLQYGIDKTISLLNGMFAFVIVDLRSKEVILARDRFGIKPLYYFTNRALISFSSELKSFYALNEFTPALRDESLSEYLIFRSVRNQTLLKDVVSLAPGHYLRFNSRGVKEIKRYFDVNEYVRSERTISKDEALEGLRESLNRSVKSQLISDVNLGCQLSGGVDSSLITYFASQNLTDTRVEGFSVDFENSNFSENNYINHVASVLGIHSRKFILDGDYYFNQLKSATWHLESPVNHPNTIGIYLLAKQSKEFVTVLLSGEGADEIFGGYARFSQLKYRYRWPFLKSLIKNRSKAFSYLKEYANKSRQAILSNAFMSIADAKALFPNFQESAVLHEREELYRSFSGSVFDRQVKYDVSTYLPDLLIRQDKMSMAHSVENRVPFLDNDLVGSTFDIPEEWLIQSKVNHEKYLLKELCSVPFGKEFSYRRKNGFGIPLQDFFNNPQFATYLSDEIFPSMMNRKIFDTSNLSNLFQKINRLTAPEREHLWIIISLEIWMRLFIDNKAEVIRGV